MYSLRSSWNLYFSNTHAVILVVDSTDRERISIVKEELMSVVANRDVSQAKILVLANKQDKRGAMTASEVSKALNLHKIKEIDWHIQACCALTGEGLAEGMEWIAQKLHTSTSASNNPTNPTHDMTTTTTTATTVTTGTLASAAVPPSK